ncbi:hypothetical protein SY83_12890 [Paenibacillus swuensis]|uniref:Cell shape determination protein CcmA n=1 Tax=Paenibacillus swuensis TaxID=1178515 RepID=A0A172TJ80_9BACL|nr:polymer-forming cytoskeletal protein [Paenibacillus swuensis]ANE47016.1 hypothetical protein SY83_12890 [Paenibacillus swuensis]
MFGRTKTNRNVNSVRTLIGEGAVLEGKLICETCLRIEGEISGDIECAGDVVIGEQGVARSNVTARELFVAGKVVGNVTVKGKLIISRSGELHGNISAAALVVEDGGVFNGVSRMERADAAVKGVRELPLTEPKTEASEISQAAG